MKNTLSSNYLFNRYSYYTYFLFYAVFLIKIKFNGWMLLKDDIKILAIPIRFLIFPYQGVLVNTATLFLSIPGKLILQNKVQKSL